MSDGIGGIEFDADELVYRAEYDPETKAPSVAVVDVVERVCDEDPAEPLYAVVDPDALDSLLESRSTRDRRGPPSVSFPYAGARVTVTADGRITVRPGANDRPDTDADIDE